MPTYTLKSKYWNGSVLYPIGAVVEFAKGKAPRGSVLYEKQAEESAKEPTVKEE